jgi:tryptophanyl-tRNA synthetase
MKTLIEDNEKLVIEFGAKKINEIIDIPDFYTFKKGNIFSHRDFDKFLQDLKNNKKCAIVSGFNASGTIHLGHKAVFDTNLYFQKKYNIPIFIPISDDESYLTKKVETQEEALKYSYKLAKQILAYGFDPKKTFFIIDQVYTNIYNLAIKLSRKVNLSEIKATYGYKNEDNIGIHFYPAIQSAHVLFPIEKYKFDRVLVPIGPDEDTHLRICRDIALRLGYNKPSVVHVSFIPGIDGEKMSKSKNNAIYFSDDKKTIIKKVNKSFSGGQPTIEEHRKLGGNPDIDISYKYLDLYFLEKEESKKIYTEYREGKILSGELKKMLSDKLIEFTNIFQKKLESITDKDIDKCILKNEF